MQQPCQAAAPRRPALTVVGRLDFGAWARAHAGAAMAAAAAAAALPPLGPSRAQRSAAQRGIGGER